MCDFNNIESRAIVACDQHISKHKIERSLFYICNTFVNIVNKSNSQNQHQKYTHNVYIRLIQSTMKILH